MKLGRIRRTGPGRPGPRALVAVHPGEDRGGRSRHRRAGCGCAARGATADAARRLAAALFPPSMSAAIALGPAFVEAASTPTPRRGDDASLPIDDVALGRGAGPAGHPRLADLPAAHEAVRRAARRRAAEPSVLQDARLLQGLDRRRVRPRRGDPLPSVRQQIDYELELGFVVGGDGRNLTPDQAQELLFGLTIFNDFSARDIQAREMGMGMGPQKCKDFAFGIGPWITTIGDPDLPPLDELSMRVRVNGEEWATGVSEGMIYSRRRAHRLRLDRRRRAAWRHHRLGHRRQRLRRSSSDATCNPGDVVELEVEGVGRPAQPLHGRAGAVPVVAGAREPQPLRDRGGPGRERAYRAAGPCRRSPTQSLLLPASGAWSPATTSRAGRSSSATDRPRTRNAPALRARSGRPRRVDDRRDAGLERGQRGRRARRSGPAHRAARVRHDPAHRRLPPRHALRRRRHRRSCSARSAAPTRTRPARADGDPRHFWFHKTPDARLRDRASRARSGR